MTAALSEAPAQSVVHDSSAPPLRQLQLVHVPCCICDDDDAVPCGLGEDFEYGTSPDTFLAMRCNQCGLIYLSPRPDSSELARIYPPTYHAFNFSRARFGIVYKVRRWLEGRRLLAWCRDLPPDAKILDVGCGDGFHLEILRDFGRPTWTIEGIDASQAAVMAARSKGLTVHQGSIESAELCLEDYDLVLLVMTIEHLADPAKTLAAIRDVLRPGGKLVIVTDNARSLDTNFFLGRHWGGYHFPRHWNLFDARSMKCLAEKVGLEVASITTQMSPVNWVYSIRNLLVDANAPAWLVNRFSLQSPLSLAAFTALDTVLNAFGTGALLRATLRKPKVSSSATPSIA